MKTVPFSEQEGDFFDRLATKSRVSALDPDERLAYDRWLKHEYDQYLKEEKMKARVMKEGLEKGLAEGRAKGRAEGRAEGREAEKWENVKKLIDAGIPIEAVSRALDIPESEIRKKLK